MDILKALSDGMKTLDEAKRPWDETKLHISDLGVWSGLKESDRKCPRQLWYRLRGRRQEPMTDGKRLMFSQGNRIEELAISALKTQGVVESAKVNVSDLCITGETDVLLKDPETGELVIVDVKTRRGNAFRFNNLVKPAEKMQVIGYAIKLENRPGCPMIHRGAILEIDREGQNFARVFEFDIRQKEYSEYKEAYSEILYIQDSKEPPAGLKPTLIRKENKGQDSLKLNIPWQCRYCNYAKTCCVCVPSAEFLEMHGKVVGHVLETDGGEIITIQEEYLDFKTKETDDE